MSFKKAMKCYIKYVMGAGYIVFSHQYVLLKDNSNLLQCRYLFIVSALISRAKCNFVLTKSNHWNLGTQKTSSPRKFDEAEN